VTICEFLRLVVDILAHLWLDSLIARGSPSETETEAPASGPDELRNNPKGPYAPVNSVGASAPGKGLASEADELRLDRTPRLNPVSPFPTNLRLVVDRL
jgi:hypothetical protein